MVGEHAGAELLVPAYTVKSYISMKCAIVQDNEVVAKEGLDYAGMNAQLVRDHLQSLKAVCQACKDCGNCHTRLSR